MTLVSSLYTGTVVHDRRRPKPHRLSYRVFSLLVDLDELPRIDASLRLFGHNRRALFSFDDRDHGDGGATPLRSWVDERLSEAGLDVDGGSVRVLCYPRMFGYVFNPLTVYFCASRSGDLLAILYEVSNTHGERHTYVMPVTDSRNPVIRQQCRKEFFVSPFLSMDCTYRFKIIPPDDRVVVSILESDPEGPLLTAVFSGRRRRLSDMALAGAALSHPLMTLKVIVGIHWQALRLWIKGTPVFPYHPAKTRYGASVGAPVTSVENRP